MRNLAHTGLRLRVCASVREAVRGADIVTTVTADKTNARILTADMIEPGMHINGVGGDCPGKTELHPDVLNGARCSSSTSRSRASKAICSRCRPTFPVTELWQVLAGRHRGRIDERQVTIFDSVGFALEDYSALRYMRDSARALGLGQTISLIPNGQPQGSVQSRSSIGGGERRRNEDEPRRLNGIGPEGRVPRKRSSTLRVSAHRLYAIGKVGLR
jgi:ornithine cyclodeaminase